MRSITTPVKVCNKKDIEDAVTDKLGAERLGDLLSVLDEWIPTEDTEDEDNGKYAENIVAFNVDKENDRVMVVTMSDYGLHSEFVEHRIYRFFPFGSRWQVSVDYESKMGIGINELIQKLLEI